MLLLTAIGAGYCYLLYGPFLREANRACKAIELKRAKLLK